MTFQHISTVIYLIYSYIGYPWSNQSKINKAVIISLFNLFIFKNRFILLIRYQCAHAIDWRIVRIFYLIILCKIVTKIMINIIMNYYENYLTLYSIYTNNSFQNIICSSITTVPIAIIILRLPMFRQRLHCNESTYW